MKIKHTSGEWQIEQESSGQLWIIPKDSHIVISEICTSGIKNQHKPTEEDRANAKLIVQAPTMYQFLIELIDALQDKKELTIWETHILHSAEEIIKSME